MVQPGGAGFFAGHLKGLFEKSQVSARQGEKAQVHEDT